MTQQEMHFEESPDDRPSFSYRYAEGLHESDFPSIRKQKIAPAGRNLVPPLSQRLLLGLISFILWLGMACFELFIIDVPVGDVRAPAFILFSMGLVTICLVLINVVFWRIGWFWVKKRLFE